ncbi:hypothetical protein PBI_GRAYSON_262 [Rhodococcus phage Grayson]|jgi:hypothetical protein|nr:hypothetical protein PBI_GRAYSON_262 [Rhodococcus phage Grayson]
MECTEVIEVDRISDTKVKIWTVRVFPSGARNIVSVVTITLPELNHTHVAFVPLEGHDTSLMYGSRNV